MRLVQVLILLQCIAVCCSVLHSACGLDLFVAGLGMLQHVAVCCSMWQNVAVCYSVLHLACGVDAFGADMIVLQYVAVCCSISQCVSVFCNGMWVGFVWCWYGCVECVAVCHSVLHLSCVFDAFGAAMSVLQCVAVSGRMLQCVAVC